VDFTGKDLVAFKMLVLSKRECLKYIYHEEKKRILSSVLMKLNEVRHGYISQALAVKSDEHFHVLKKKLGM
jgi:hypothetical protein